MPMVYIKAINENTFLHASFSNEAFKLRNFAPPDGKVAEIVREQAPPELTATRIRQLASVMGNYLIPIKGGEKSIDDYRYWHDQTLRLNKEYLKREPPNGGGKAESGDTWKKHVVQIIVGVVILVVAGLIMWALKIR
jgi:hypothetical protein